MNALTSKRWDNLVAETQFATDMVLTGIRRVCALPMNPRAVAGLPNDQTYPLHVALHMYTSGLERLCKLALACHGFVGTGEFASVRRYSHRLSELLAALEALDLEPFASSGHAHLARPVDEYGDELVDWLERYASGRGRYELLDSLTSEVADVVTWDTWVDFCSRGVVSDDVKLSISVHQGIYDALTDVWIAADLEASAQTHFEMFSTPMSEVAVAVGLAMYRRARWAAEVLAVVTNYTRQELPILSEVVYVLTHSSDDFFNFEVAKLVDRDVIMEELLRHNDTFRSEGSCNFDDDLFEEG